MEIILMFAIGLVIVIIAVLGIIGGLTQRMKKPTDELSEKIMELESRVQELEKKQ
ncbi:hypothetical protein [Oceanobacillus indicireducens]|uniref:DUF4083 domain-containing protein n=1 Tax=Oceanobacillus indicireducens TaxID=1004261 RepID=A0A917XZ79_9BACI|nr:hypothetical protein [Oceanobacillus indicireducens]GGN57879.1 hypothetical protein GCM10007971_19330 [Oceanobacillus indicireducens]